MFTFCSIWRLEHFQKLFQRYKNFLSENFRSKFMTFSLPFFTVHFVHNSFARDFYSSHAAHIHVTIQVRLDATYSTGIFWGWSRAKSKGNLFLCLKLSKAYFNSKLWQRKRFSGALLCSKARTCYYWTNCAVCKLSIQLSLKVDSIHKNSWNTKL